MTTILVFLGFYLLGVIIACVCVAWLDAGIDRNSEHFHYVAYSWLVPVIFFLAFIISMIGSIYKWCRKTFERYD